MLPPPESTEMQKTISKHRECPQGSSEWKKGISVEPANICYSSQAKRLTRWWEVGKLRRVHWKSTSSGLSCTLGHKALGFSFLSNFNLVAKGSSCQEAGSFKAPALPGISYSSKKKPPFGREEGEVSSPRQLLL